MTRWLLPLLVLAGCAKGLEDLYPFHCPVDMSACPLGINSTCDARVGCTYTCTTDAQCVGGDGNPRDDLACINGICELSCSDGANMSDPAACADGYTCGANPGVTETRAQFTCTLM